MPVEIKTLFAYVCNLKFKKKKEKKKKSVSQCAVQLDVSRVEKGYILASLSTEDNVASIV